MLDVKAKRRDWVVKMTLAKHYSTSTTNNFVHEDIVRAHQIRSIYRYYTYLTNVASGLGKYVGDGAKCLHAGASSDDGSEACSESLLNRLRSVSV